MADFVYHNLTRDLQKRLPVTRWVGLSMPDVDHISARSPRQHGASYIATYYRPREFSLEWAQVGCSPAQFEARYRDLILALDPVGNGELHITDAVGDKFTLACHLVSALTVEGFNEGRGTAILAQFIADDPYFKGTVVTTNYTTAAEAGLTIPFTIPATITGGANVQVVINNTGHVEALPFITVDPSITDLTLTNLTTGKTLRVTTTVGLALTEVDMANQTVESVAGGTRTNLLAFVTGDFWSLAPGNNTIKIAIANAAVRSGTIVHTPRLLAVV